MQSSTVLVVGNGAAGYSCASRLVRAGIGVTMIGPGAVVERPPLSKIALAEGRPRYLADLDRLAEQKIDHVDGLAVSLDLPSRAVEVQTASAREWFHAEQLVLALGLDYSAPPIDGGELALVNSTPAGLLEISARLAGGAKSVIVIGAGLVGCESAATLALQGHDVHLVDIAAEPVLRLHDPLPSIFRGALADAGVRFTGAVAIRSLSRSDAGYTVSTAGHGELVADLVIAATGGRFPRLAGLPGGPILTDSGMRMPDLHQVFAIGDLAGAEHVRFGRLQTPHWDNALRTGEVAASQIIGTGGVLDQVPFWWSDIGTHFVAEYGIAAAAVQWSGHDGLRQGRDADGALVCVLLIDERERQREARDLMRRALEA